MSVENITEKKMIIPIMIIMISSSIILFSITKPILAIIFSAFIILGFLLLLANKIADAKDLKVDDTPNNAGENAEISAEGQLKTQAELKEDLKVDDTPQDMTVSAEEAERIQAKLEEESRNKWAQEQMKAGLHYAINAFGAPITNKAQGVENECSIDDTQAAEVSQDKSYWVEQMPSLPAINAFGAPIAIKAQGVENGCPVGSTQTMVVPYTITLGTHDKTQNEQLDLAEKMQYLPTHINGIGDTITAMESTDRRVFSTISFDGMGQQHQPYVQNYMSLMQSPPARTSALDYTI